MRYQPEAAKEIELSWDVRYRVPRIPLTQVQPLI